MLIIKLSSLGDIVHAIPTVNALASIYPEAQIDWLIYSKFSEIIKSQNSIKTIHELENKKLSTIIQTIKKLRKENYDLVIDLQGLMKTAIIARSISHNVIGFKEPREKLAACFYKTKVDAGDVIDDSMHVIERNLEMAKFLGNSSLDINFGEMNQSLFKKLPDLAHNADGTFRIGSKICLIPCTTWETKHWPAENWVTLMQELKTRNQQLEIYIIGTLKDLIKIEAIICKVRVPFHLVVNKTLSELPDFFSEMDIVIGVDTGPLHIAAAALYGSNAQVIGLYGPTSGARTGPYGFKYISASKEVTHKRHDDMSMLEISPGLVLESMLS